LAAHTGFGAIWEGWFAGRSGSREIPDLLREIPIHLTCVKGRWLRICNDPVCVPLWCREGTGLSGACLSNILEGYMSNTPHELAAEFPEKIEQMSALKQSDAHFNRLFEEYHEVNRAVHRGETDVEPTSDDHMVAMRKQRMRLKDEISAYLK
jgi:uncharacterized protein YdcH (DUF465 family)